MTDRAMPAVSGHFSEAEGGFDMSSTEHISLGDDFSARASEARTISDRMLLNDALRGREAVITLYEQGFLEYVEKRRGTRGRLVPIDLRYLDPTPTVERRYPDRLFKISCATGGLALVTGALAAFGVLSVYLGAVAAVMISATVVLGIACFYLSHERIRFYTQHGRAVALELRPGVGCIGRYHAILPNLIRAIEGAGEDIGEDTAIFLRSEMREHYRLRKEGVLSVQECSDSTARILAHFDNPV